MSPPISWQNLRLMASPRPVPPNLRVVEASAWREGLEELGHLLRRHPDAGVGDSESDQWTVISTQLRAGTSALQLMTED